MEKGKLKISFLLPNRGSGGGVRAIMRIGNELLQKGHQVRVFYREDMRQFRQHLRKVYLYLRHGGKRDWLRCFQGPSFCYDKLDPSVFEPDEFILPICTQTMFDAWALPETAGIKVLYCHGGEIEKWDRMVESWKLPVPKIVISSHLVVLLQKEAGQRVVGIVPNGIDTNQYYPPVSQGRRTGIGTNYGSSRAKNPEGVISVLGTLRERLPQAEQYVFSAACRPVGLEDVNYKRWPGVPQARQMYSSCRVWFIGSRSEGFSLPVLEAMACGCAVVSTDCGGTRDIIQDGRNGFLVEPENEKALAEKIISVYKNEVLCRQIVEEGYKTVKRFTWQRSADILEGYLQQIYCEQVDAKAPL